MRSPVRSVPPNVEHAAARARWLRAIDAVLAWLVAWAAVGLAFETVTASASAIVAILGVVLVALVAPLRRGWRPVSALGSISASQALRPGDHAWLVLPDHIEPVIVTARRGLRLVVASPQQGSEGLSVRRTRILVVPAKPLAS
jgi:hypothetical protein